MRSQKIEKGLKFTKILTVLLILVSIGSATTSGNSPTAQLEITESNGFYTLDASESYDDGTIVQYQFDRENDGTYDVSTSSATYSTSFNQVPETAKVKVTDDDGHTDTALANYEDPVKVCDIHSGYLYIDEKNIKKGQSTEGRVTIFNDGSNQEVRVTFYKDGQQIDQTTKIVREDKERFTTTLSPEETSEISMTADTVGNPCGNDQIGTDSEKIYVDSVEEKGVLELIVEDQNGDRVENARVTADSNAKYTDEYGRVVFSLEPNQYQVRVSKNYYFTEEFSVNIESGERETKTVELLSKDAESRLTIKTVDQDGNELRNVDVDVENSESFSDETDTEGEAVFDLRPDHYQVTASKSGYSTESRTLEVQPGSDRDIVIEMMETDQREGDAFIDVNVEDRTGDSIEDARVRVVDGDTETRFTNKFGKAQFEVEPDTYEIRVTKSGFRSEIKTVSVSEGDFRTVNFRLEERAFDRDDARLDVRVEDQNGDELRNVRIRAENSETETRFTDRDGRARFFLEPDNYDVTASKSGYRSQTKSIRLREGDRETLRFELRERSVSDRDLRITDTRLSKSSVCRGDTLFVYANIRNDKSSDQRVTFAARVSGATVAKSVNIDARSTEEKSLRINNVQGSGSETIRIAVTNGNSDEVTRNVRVNDCDDEEPVTTASAITVNVEPQEVQAGESVRVSGFVDGTRGSQQVEILIDGNKVADVSTDPDGFYKAYITPQNVGVQEVRARSGQRSGVAQIRVLPNVYVGSVTAPDRTFESREFEICADVQSQVDPSVVLKRNGERIDSKNDRGNVCFDTQVQEPGDYTYEVFASAWGVTGSQTREVEVLEQDTEVKNFPDKLAMVRSGDGIARVTVYNTGEDLRTYDVEVSGIPDDWFDTTEKQVQLSKGEKKNVYFYVTPEAEGNFAADVTVDRDGTQVFQETISISSGGTTESRKKSWIEKIASLFRNY